MSLVPEYEDSSEAENSPSDSDDSETSVKIGKEQQDTTPKGKLLPAPNFGGTRNATDEVKSSVFKNPFIEAENAKEAILQKHVKMVESRDNTVIINGKKICWNYRKGRCRFGHKCKFAHDSDIQKSDDQIDLEKKSAVQNSVVCQSDQTGASVKTVPLSTTGLDSETIGDDLDSLKQKRKRPGLTQGLKPGKKVMKQYLKHQKK
ncbi:unnamed protein product [Phaedon cochleariae]|uniref:C3H1-type domain-containing protein n=1 Tax=Phaedon cochleariae TaxID=80249 RepID=A0A9N9SAL5_PHACE|nr:unnamed protein product [Phaedon cochleariae]